jgi:threonylcarbamoyladenosine tRNA methylthiotransferase CDKAL1
MSVYGQDMKTTPPTDLPTLITTIRKEVPGEWRLRIGMANPLFLQKMLPRLLDAMDDPRIYKFLHVPVQSGSLNVLKDMHRGHDAKSFATIAKALRERYPGAQLSTDIIAGYPAETEDDFRMTLDLLEKVRPDFINMSKFSSRKGTIAASLKQLPSQIVARRSAQLAQVCKGIVASQAREWIGWEGEALIVEEKQGKASVLGYSAHYRPILIRKEDLPQRMRLPVPGSLVRVHVIDSDKNGNVFGTTCKDNSGTVLK